jgi:hypothetical protein
MASVKTTFDQKSLVVANILSAGETIDYSWSIDEMYQIVVTKGTVTIGGSSYNAISVNDVPAGTNLSVAATTDASFLTLLRSDNSSVVNQIMPEDATNYYDFMQGYTPSWYAQGLPSTPPSSIATVSGDKTVSSGDMKTMILEGWA